MDPNKVKIELDGEFDAAALEEIIHDLCIARASIEPRVPSHVPAPDSDKRVLDQEEPLFTVANRAGGGLRIWLRHEGFGWLAFSLSGQQRKDLADFLSKEIGHSVTSH